MFTAVFVIVVLRMPTLLLLVLVCISVVLSVLLCFDFLSIKWSFVKACTIGKVNNSFNINIIKSFVMIIIILLPLRLLF